METRLQVELLVPLITASGSEQTVIVICWSAPNFHARSCATTPS